jgi:hypothetical protein
MYSLRKVYFLFFYKKVNILRMYVILNFKQKIKFGIIINIFNLIFIYGFGRKGVLELNFLKVAIHGTVIFKN